VWPLGDYYRHVCTCVHISMYVVYKQRPPYPSCTDWMLCWILTVVFSNQSWMATAHYISTHDTIQAWLCIQFTILTSLFNSVFFDLSYQESNVIKPLHINSVSSMFTFRLMYFSSSVDKFPASGNKNLVDHIYN